MTAASQLLSLSIEDFLRPILIQLLIIIAVARLFGALARLCGQPSVVGEILAGIMLGPSLLGRLSPELFQLLFHPPLPGVDAPLADAAVQKVFGVLAQIGLILLLCLVGLEFDFQHLKLRGRSAVVVMLVGIVVPFLAGAALASGIHPHLEAHDRTGSPVPMMGLTLFLGTAFSITALPVLGRIMHEMGIQRTQIAVVVITAAAVGDAVGWMMLASVSALAQSSFSLLQTGLMTAQVLLFVAVTPWTVPWPYLQRAVQNQERFPTTALAIVLLLVLASAITTNAIGIFAIFGAFYMGAVLSQNARIREALNARLRDIVTVFFVPIFFTYTGLRTEITSLDSAEKWLMAVIVISVAFAAKFIGCGLAARVTGFNSREATIIGALMNCRGLMELIVINVGYDLGVIPKSLFCILVLMAILSNLLAAPIAVAFRRGTELESALAASGFVRHSRD